MSNSSARASSTPTPATDAKTSEIRALVARPAPPRPTSVRPTPKPPPEARAAESEEEEVEELRTMDLTELAATVRRAHTLVPPPLPSTPSSAPTLPAPPLAESRVPDAELERETLPRVEAPNRAAKARAMARAAFVSIVAMCLFVGYAARAAVQAVRSWLPHLRPLLARAFACVRDRLTLEWRRAKERAAS